LDNGPLCRWLNGQARVSPRITAYYLDAQNRDALTEGIFRNILPLMYDSGMAIQKIYSLVLQDDGISEKKKEELTAGFPCRSDREEAAFISGALLFGMSRSFTKRDAKTNKLLTAGNLSPVLADFIMTGAASVSGKRRIISFRF